MGREYARSLTAYRRSTASRSHAISASASVAAFREAVHVYSPIPEKEWAWAAPQLAERSIVKGAHLSLEGRPASRIEIVLSGLVRSYYLDDGRDRVRSFTREGEFVAAYDSIVTGEPALYSLQALEDTHLIGFEKGMLDSAYDRHACWERLGRKIAEHLWIVKERKSRFHRLSIPEARYRDLSERGSWLLDRVPLKEISSYIGVEPETLSRIRARMRSEGRD